MLELPVTCNMAPPSYNFHVVEWDEFNAELDVRLMDIPALAVIDMEVKFHEAVSNLMEVVQDTI